MTGHILRFVRWTALAVLAVLCLATLQTNAAVPGSFALVSVNLATGGISPIGCIGVCGTLEAFALVDESTGYAVASRNALTTFSLSDPANPTSTTTISGLDRGEQVIGIDIRPATGELFGLNDDSRIISIDPATGIATVKGASFSSSLDGTVVGFDILASGPAYAVVRGSGLC